MNLLWRISIAVAFVAFAVVGALMFDRSSNGVPLLMAIPAVAALAATAFRVHPFVAIAIALVVGGGLAIAGTQALVEISNHRFGDVDPEGVIAMRALALVLVLIAAPILTALLSQLRARSGTPQAQSDWN
ncbi:hypothetical protein [Phenylobacterium sp.]|uniref:hypothetical protein n=1 Tax=Phenylobacterium sp. TaxID=1871053 RepID=UPI002C6509BF|nr:hypothetical protein [Phenylobacterium sp.]HLZ75204.1 hypothetical protein [Phenylobacterium sp.]